MSQMICETPKQTQCEIFDRMTLSIQKIYDGWSGSEDYSLMDIGSEELVKLNKEYESLVERYPNLYPETVADRDIRDVAELLGKNPHYIEDYYVVDPYSDEDPEFLTKLLHTRETWEERNEPDEFESDYGYFFPNKNLVVLLVYV